MEQYATSGVLCVARSKQAAAAACKLFAERKVTKEYLALLDGHVPFPNASDVVRDSDDERPKKRPKITGIKSPSGHFEVAKRAAQKASMRGEKLTSEQEMLLSMRWKDVKRNKKMHQVYVDLNAADIAAWKSNNGIQAKKQPQKFRSITTLSLDGGKRPVYRIYGGLANTRGFRMQFATPESPGRPCETEMEVLEHGYVGEKNRRPASRVILRPKSGRRHQLRLHSLGMGHPIIGDATYNVRDNGDEESGDKEEDAMPRMMLHAWNLILPFQDKTRTARAPDPFKDLFIT